MPDITITDQYLFFWRGWPSQWSKRNFVVDGVTYNCCEQFMMAEKARVFGDADAERAILATSSQREQKAIGRTVRGFDLATWNSVCRGIVYRGNLERFSQSEEDRERLLATGTLTIVEASPEDPVWGIALAADDPRAQDPAKWQGTNWLGVALMQVRDELRRRVGESAQPVEAWLTEQLRTRESMGFKG